MEASTKNLFSIYEKIENVKNRDIKVSKNGDSYHGSYITLDHLLEVYEPILKEEGIGFFHISEVNGISTIFYDLDNVESQLKSTFPYVHGAIGETKDIGGAQTYGKRYNITAFFCVKGVDFDDDTDSISPKVAASKGETKRKTTNSETKKASKESKGTFVKENLQKIIGEVRENDNDKNWLNLTNRDGSAIVERQSKITKDIKTALNTGALSIDQFKELVKAYRNVYKVSKPTERVVQTLFDKAVTAYKAYLKSNGVEVEEEIEDDFEEPKYTVEDEVSVEDIPF